MRGGSGRQDAHLTSFAPSVRGFRFHRCARRSGKSRCVHAVRFVSTLLVPTPPRDTGNRTSQHRGGRGPRVRVRARVRERTCIYFPGSPVPPHPYLIWRRSQLGDGLGPGPKPCPKRGRRGTLFVLNDARQSIKSAIEDRTYPRTRTQKYTARSISWSWHANVIYIHAFREMLGSNRGCARHHTLRSDSAFADPATLSAR